MAATFDGLEQRIENLILRLDEVKRENDALRNREHAWTQERARLMEKHEHALAKLEAMISRLKSLE